MIDSLETMKTHLLLPYTETDEMQCRDQLNHQDRSDNAFIDGNLRLIHVVFMGIIIVVPKVVD